jgi:hypothetical protein
MAHRAFSALGIAALSFSLAACGGGSSGSSTFPGPGPTSGPGSVLISPSSLAFAGPGAASQTFTVSSSLGNVSGVPAVDPIGCAPVANIGTASTSLPATYTVTPTGNGSCSLVVTINHQSATIGITVGGGSGASLSTSTSTVTLFVGGTSGSVTVTASSGTLIPDASACAGIASVSGAGGASPQTFTISPLSAGSCTFTVVDGASSVSVPVTVNASSGGQNALFITPSSLDFASQAAPAQQATLSFSGNAGQVSVNENDCIGQTGKPKLVFVTIGTPGQPVSLPATVTVTPYTTQGGGGSGTCSIFFTSSVGATQAVLTVTVH